MPEIKEFEKLEIADLLSLVKNNSNFSKNLDFVKILQKEQELKHISSSFRENRLPKKYVTLNDQSLVNKISVYGVGMLMLIFFFGITIFDLIYYQAPVTTELNLLYSILLTLLVSCWNLLKINPIPLKRYNYISSTSNFDFRIVGDKEKSYSLPILILHYLLSTVPENVFSEKEEVEILKKILLALEKKNIPIETRTSLVVFVQKIYHQDSSTEKYWKSVVKLIKDFEKDVLLKFEKLNNVVVDDRIEAKLSAMDIHKLL